MPRIRLLFLFVTTPLLAGCGDSPGDPYDPKWRYTIRTDPIVLTAPTAHPTAPILDGRIENYIRRLPSMGGRILDPKALPDSTRIRLTEILDELFGTPAEPKVAVGETDTLTALALDADTLKASSSGYKMRCTSCHGVNGDGRGPSGLFLTPLPRDYRTGQFKRVSGSGHATGRPRFDDLMRVLKEGVPGTSMTSFAALPDDTLRGLVGTVIHLSIRGEVERELLSLVLADPEDAMIDPALEASKLAHAVLRKWVEAQANGPAPVAVPDRPEVPTLEYHGSIRRGQKLFVSAGCVSCHEGYGKTSVYRADVWGLPNHVRNLSEPTRRWGSHTADMARQIRCGIRAANMPSAATLNDDEVRDLVNFVRELPYPKRLPDDVRSEVER
jgi:mono/diheme cytochrome c family protein